MLRNAAINTVETEQVYTDTLAQQEGPAPSDPRVCSDGAARAGGSDSGVPRARAAPAFPSATHTAGIGRERLTRCVFSV